MQQGKKKGKKGVYGVIFFSSLFFGPVCRLAWAVTNIIMDTISPIL